VVEAFVPSVPNETSIVVVTLWRDPLSALLGSETYLALERKMTFSGAHRERLLIAE
jgi:hypothetical protein